MGGRRPALVPQPAYGERAPIVDPAIMATITEHRTAPAASSNANPSGPSRPLVPILPAEPGGHDREPPNTPPLVPTKKRKASLACTTCQRRKTKCGGGPPPCEPCQRLKTECIFSIELDQRRRALSRQRLDELEQHERVLKYIMEAIRHPDDEQHQHITSLVRSQAPMEELRAFVEANSVSSSTAQPSAASTPSIEEAALTPQDSRQRTTAAAAALDVRRRRVMSMNELVDVSQLEVPAKPWTTVTDDDQLVSHLVSLYFTWVYPFGRTVEKDTFIAAMKSKDIDSTFCSPLLVNAMLALASHFSSWPIEDTAEGPITSTGQSFFDEAMELRASEQRKPSLRNLQALALLVSASIFRNRRNERTELLKETRDMYFALGFPTQLEPPRDLIIKDYDEIRKIWGPMAWNMHSITTILSVMTMRPNAIPRPAVPIDQLSCHGLTDMWFPYPSPRRRVRIDSGLLFIHKCKLLQLVDETLTKTLDEKSLDVLEQLEAHFNAATARWYEELPGLLAANVAIPPILDMHLYYYLSIVAMLEHFYKKRGDLSSVDAPPSENPAISLVPKDSPTYRLLVANIRKAVVLLRESRRLFGCSQLSPTMVQACCRFGLIMATVLESPQNEGVFAELCLFILFGSQQIEFCRRIAMQIRILTNRGKVQLPREIGQMMEEFENNTWRPEAYRTLSGESWRNFAAFEETGVPISTDND